jgi:recombination protein RecA
MYGNPETTTGGKALKFYSSIRMDIRKADVLKDGAEIIGNRTKVKIVKNKLAPPFKTAEFDIMYGTGINNEGCVIDMAIELDVIQKSGSWYSYNGEKIGQGKDNVRIFLQENPDIMKTVQQQIREKLN